MRSVRTRPILVGLVVTATAAGVTLGAMAVAQAAYNPGTPPYPADPNNAGTAAIYDASTGAKVVGGSTATKLNSYYFGADTDFNPNHTRATVFGYLAEAGKDPGNFSGQSIGANTPYPVTTAPAPVSGFGTRPVAKGDSTQSFSSLYAAYPNTAASTSDFYELYQLRVRTTVPTPTSDVYAYVDIQIDPTSNTWKVVGPASSATAPTPTASPTVSPTASPTVSPTASPTASPTVSPTASPTVSPTASPTASPTVSPTASPTASPTVSPTASPTASPTVSPTASPTASPTVSPTASPTTSPTPGGTSVGLNAQPDLITYGQSFRVSGRVSGVTTGTQRLYLNSTTNGTTVRTTIYATNGAFSETVTPSYSANYTVSFVGDDTHSGSTSASQRTLVATRVVRTGSTVSGRTLTYRGTIAPALSGEVVNLAYTHGSAGGSLGSAKVARDGSFTITGTLPAGSSSVYAVVGATSVNNRGTSAPITVTVA